MTLFSRKFLEYINLIREYIFNLNEIVFRTQNRVQANLFVDISTYNSSEKLIFRIKHHLLNVIFLLLTLVLAYNLNEIMVFQSEEVQTLLLIQKVMAFGFITSGFLALVFLSLLMPFQNPWKGIKQIEKNAYKSGIWTLTAGAIFILICLLKFFSLVYTPSAYEFFIQIGPATIYVLHGSFFLGIAFCMGIIFNRILSLSTYLEIYLKSLGNN